MPTIMVSVLLGIFLLQATLSTASFPASFYRCPEPEVPEHGSYTLVSRNVGYKVTFSCSERYYQLLGSETLTCMLGPHGAHWSGVTPACVCQRLSTRGSRPCARERTKSAKPRDGCMDPPPSPGSNAIILHSNTQGVLYRCRDVKQYIASAGNRLIRCVRGTRARTRTHSHRHSHRHRHYQPQWDPEASPLSCRRKAICNDNGAILHGSRQIPRPAKEGDKAYFFCNRNARLVGVTHTVCNQSGQWADPWPRCVLTGCPMLPLPDNGVVFQPAGSHIAVGVTVTYGCFLGYQLVSMSERTCQSSGSWSGTAPTCQAQNCSSLSAPVNGLVQLTGNTAGSIAMYTCFPGHNLVGNLGDTLCQYVANLNMGPDPVDSNVVGNITQACQDSNTRVCQLNGQWTGESPICQPVDCGTLSNPENGMVTVETTTFNSIAQYSCNSGYVLLGDAARDCREDGRWNCLAPVCLPACDELNNPSNGTVSIIRVMPTGLIATYSCDDGFRLVGEVNRTCLNNRMWSGQPPTCQAIDCGPPPLPPPNGMLSFTSTQFRSVATYTCNMDYALVGNNTLVCRETSQWTGTLPACVCDCVGDECSCTIRSGRDLHANMEHVF